MAYLPVGVCRYHPFVLFVLSLHNDGPPVLKGQAFHLQGGSTSLFVPCKNRSIAWLNQWSPIEITSPPFLVRLTS